MWIMGSIYAMEYYSIIKEIEGLNLQADDRTKDATHCSHIGPLQKNFAYSSSIIFSLCVACVICGD